MIKVSAVYSIRNVVNFKRYVGSSNNVHTRWNKHRSEIKKGVHPNTHMQNAFRKYGEESFVFEILEEAERDKLLIVEQAWIDNLKPEYNKAKFAGSPMNGRHHTDEAKQKIGMGSLGSRRTDEIKRRMSLAKLGNTGGRGNRGKHHSDKTKAKISAANLGNKHTDDVKQRMSLSMMGNTRNLGKRATDETRRKMSLAHLKSWEQRRTMKLSGDNE